MAKSHWHAALHSAHKSCTHGHVFWKRGGVKRELVAPGFEIKDFIQALLICEFQEDQIEVV